jgi:hypothetical protein
LPKLVSGLKKARSGQAAHSRRGTAHRRQNRQRSQNGHSSVAEFRRHGPRVVIAQLNIEHYRRKLATEANAAKRLALLRLLAKEEARLAELKHSTGAQPA